MTNSLVAKPPLPDGYSIPEEVNGWHHDPASNKNGHIWSSPDGSAAVGVFGFGGTIRVKVIDDRVTGLGATKTVHQLDYEHSKDYIEPADQTMPPDAVVEAIDVAGRWMEKTDPSWSHPAVEDAAFDPPVGFVLDRYYMTERQHTVCYRQEDADSRTSLCMDGCNPPASLETRDYIYVEAWRGSGNAEIALAPFLRAHNHQKTAVIDPPDECGLAVALKLARDWIREQTGATRDEPAAGQTGLGAYSG